MSAPVDKKKVVDTPIMGAPDFEMLSFIPLRTRSTRKFFKKLNDATATGNDQISASILKRLVDELATPFTLVCRRLLLEGCWPDVWKVHLIVPIYKKLSAFNVNNYRGVHLTSVLSKVAERVIGVQLVALLQHNVCGENQWAFRTGVGCKDLVTMLLMSWILGICTGYKIGAYLGYISVAFDCVLNITC